MMTYLDEVPDLGAVVPEGTYIVTVEDIEKGTSSGSGGKPQKLMYSLTVRITEPEAYMDNPLYDNFVIGSDADPYAQSEETWKASMGARRFKQLVKASQVSLDSVDSGAAPEDQTDQIVQLVREQPVVVSVDIDTDDGSYDPRFKGRKRNRNTGYYPLGTRTPGVVGEAQAPPAGRPMPRPAVPKPTAARPAPRAASTPIPPPIPTPPVRPGPGRPSAPVRGARPTSAPPPARATSRPAAAPTLKKGDAINCDECVHAGLPRDVAYPDGALVSRAEFPAHIDGHGEE